MPDAESRGMTAQSAESPSKSLCRDDRGISMLWTAMAVFFLIGSAALAVDISGAMGAARADQNTADLVCLAGVAELPDETAALNTAAAYVDANWPVMSGATLTITGSTATYTDGSGNSVYMDAAHGGDDAMYVKIIEIVDSTFARVIGQDTIPVSQEAACSGQSVQIGTGILPMGALAGAWHANLFDCAAKVTGNCGAISPFGGGGSSFRDATADGVTGDFRWHRGDETDVVNDIMVTNCSDPSTPCNAMKTETGNMVGPFRQGLGDRLGTPDINQSCSEPYFNCDTLNDVMGGASATQLSSAPPEWIDDIYGTFADANALADHYWVQGEGVHCDSPRLATIPILNYPGKNKPLDWDLGDDPGTWPNGAKWMKVVGFYTIYMREPDTVAEITGSDAIVADVLWFDESVKCDNGDYFQSLGALTPVDAGVRLVAP